jgi:hypothetical protein
VYTSILIHTGKGERGRVEPDKKIRGATVHKAALKIAT